MGQVVSGVGARITPAYAGKSGYIATSEGVFGDHPRLCGEKPANNILGPVSPGSPPPMRGKVESELELRKKSGITPAYAGKSSPLKIPT